MSSASARASPRLVEYLSHMYRSVGALYQLIERNPFGLLEPETRAVAESPASRLSRVLFALFTLGPLIEELYRLCIEARRWRLSRRVTVFEEGWEIRGSVIWAVSISRFCRCEPPLQTVSYASIASPENLLLRTCVQIAQRLCNAIEEILGESAEILRRDLRSASIELAGLETLLGVVKELSEKARAIERDPLVGLLPRVSRPESFARRILYELESRRYTARWVGKLVTVAREIVNLAELVSGELNDLRVALTHIGLFTRAVSRSLRLLSWRLYELYVLRLVLKVLSTAHPLAKVYSKDRKFVIALPGRKITILYNTTPRSEGMPSKLGDGYAQGIEVDTLPPTLLAESSGRPDITVITEADGRKKIAVIETKFSASPGYLSQARFKLLAYVYEYGADTGALLFPGVISRRNAFEEEEQETVRLLREAVKRGGIEATLFQSKTKLYIVPIEPRQQAENHNLKQLRGILLSANTP